MSRPIEFMQQHMQCFPRVSGDEPVEYLHEQGFYQFSPRERG